MKCNSIITVASVEETLKGHLARAEKQSGYMSHELQIFLSHKKGDSERNARQIASDLALFDGPNVTVQF